MTAQLMIVTGLSGSGMSSAMNVFEDLGYFCVDNLPVQLIPSFVHLFEMKESGITRAALSVNLRDTEFQRDFPRLEAELRQRKGLETTLIFLEASDAFLQRRYSETRRPPPAVAVVVASALFEAFVASRTASAVERDARTFSRAASSIFLPGVGASSGATLGTPEGSLPPLET